MTLRDQIRAIQRRVGVTADGIIGPITVAATLRALDACAAPAVEPKPPAWAPTFDERTEKNLATLAHNARERFEPFLFQAFAIASAMGVEAKVISGYRDKAAQARAKASGASRANWGYSWHNFGIAIDLGLFRGRSYVDADNPNLAWTVYSAIGEIAPQYGIEWGGSWTSFVDSPHFHLDRGRSTPNAADRKALAEGTFFV